jgi:predicted transcriptional regulator
MPKIALNLRIDADLKKQLGTLAKLENRPLSNYLETLLRQHVAGQAQLTGKPAAKPPQPPTA